MTRNQLTYQANLETARANFEKERENKRSNMAREAETNRSNLVKEAETERSNRKNEKLQTAKIIADTASNVLGTAGRLVGGRQASLVKSAGHTLSIL